jgi:hypothetical protein
MDTKANSATVLFSDYPAAGVLDFLSRVLVLWQVVRMHMNERFINA